MKSTLTNARPITVALVGAGHRTAGYARYALDHPDRMKVVAVADPNAGRRDAMARLYAIPESRQFRSYEELAATPCAEAAINGTMDDLHYASTRALLQAGYHVLLEKPIAQTMDEVLDLARIARARDRVVMICHVLRYAPFYRTIKTMLAAGKIGRILTLHSSENVSYHHVTVGYVRGKWNRSETSTSILMAKCCHDLDLMAWLLHGQVPVRVASFGALVHYRPENAPPGSAQRCLEGCQIEKTCPYSARAQYVVNDKWDWAKVYVWPDTNMTGDEKLEFLRTSPHGRCVWHSDNNQVDRQSVLVEFAGGVTATHNLLCGTARPTRTMHLVGTTGEIEGDFETGILKYRTFNVRNGPDYDEQEIDVNKCGGGGGGGHGGGDTRLIADFVALIGNPADPELGQSRIEDSIHGHLIGFAADRALSEHRVVETASLGQL